MNASRNANWGNEAGMEHAAILDGDRDLSGVTAVSAGQTAGDGCAEILHGLNNVLASMLLNAQVLEWKLPSYSRSRRYLHEIERNAQRGGELVKRLLEELEKSCSKGLSSSRRGVEVPGLTGAECAAEALELEAACPAADPQPRAAS
jgi:hypothetical protein